MCGLGMVRGWVGRRDRGGGGLMGGLSTFLPCWCVLPRKLAIFQGFRPPFQHGCRAVKFSAAYLKGQADIVVWFKDSD